jgi:ADP-heptose:LPS heptosyltransferase
MKILAVRIGRVGDTVMMTPALNALISYYPDAEITLLVSPIGRLLLKDFHPNIKQLWTWDRSGLLKPYRDKRKLTTLLEQSDFDKIICFDTSPRIGALFSDTNSEFHQYSGSKTLIHCAKAYLNFLAEIGHQPVENNYNFLPVETAARDLVAVELQQHGISATDSVLMIHPTFSGYSPIAIRKRQAKLRKLWLPENYGELARRLKKNDPALKIIMVLLPDEFSFGKKILSYSDNNILLLKSESTFERYKAMIQRADVLLTPDSGPMHMASALGTKIVAFFSMKDPGDCGPYMEPSHFTILRSENTAHPEKGINAIDVDSVTKACIEQLNTVNDEAN